MVKRNIIRTRDAIKFIGDGQEQKLKKDRLIESWIKVTLLHSFTYYALGKHIEFIIIIIIIIIIITITIITIISFSANFINVLSLLRCFSIPLFRY